MQTRQKILIVRLSAIGDVVHSLPVLHALKKADPGVFLGWAVEEKAAGLIVGNPLVDRVHVMPSTAWKKRGLSWKNVAEFIAFVREIRDERYAISIDLQELFRSGAISFLSGAGRRIAHEGAREFADIFANEKLPFHDTFDPDKPIVERYLEPAAYLGAAVDEVKFSLPPASKGTREYVDELLMDTDGSKKTVVLSPATTWESKHWAEGYWSELLGKIADRCNVIFTGTQDDLDLIGRITAAARTARYLIVAGRTSLEQLTEVFRRADVVVAPDSGPAHIASATGIPAVICIFGSTAYKRSGPRGTKHFSMSAGIDCQPCFKRSCPRRNDKMACVRRMTPGDILSILGEHITPSPPG